jgi:phosphatidylserine decarboxylase
MKLTGYGRREWLFGGFVAFGAVVALFLLLPVIGWTWGITLASMICLVYGCLAALFRDPPRIVPEEPNLLVSPADGVVRDIELLKGADENEFFEGRSTIRVGIFLSVLNVHLNRAPCDLEVKEKRYKKGKFHDARSPLASKENESMTIYCSSTIEERTFPLIVRQISGAIAKRIVCEAEVGSEIKKGERFGMIKFGSRTELFLPAEPWMKLSVKVGDKVYAGSSVIASVSGKESDAKKTQ